MLMRQNYSYTNFAWDNAILISYHQNTDKGRILSKRILPSLLSIDRTSSLFMYLSCFYLFFVLFFRSSSLIQKSYAEGRFLFLLCMDSLFVLSQISPYFCLIFTLITTINQILVDRLLVFMDGLFVKSKSVLSACLIPTLFTIVHNA